MAHFAKVESKVIENVIENNKVVKQIIHENVVTDVIVADQEFVDTLEGTWIKTSYNTREGKHLLGGIPLRKNFACRGYTYDATRDAFIPPKLFDSWVLNEDTCTWYPPVEMPKDGKGYRWVEETKSWVEATGV